MRWLFLVLVGCTYPPPQATAIDAQRAGLELAQLTEGRALLIEKCTDSACHRTPLPQDVSPAQWPHEVADMAERAQIDRRQQKLIEQYLVTCSQGCR